MTERGNIFPNFAKSLWKAIYDEGTLGDMVLTYFDEFDDDDDIDDEERAAEWDETIQSIIAKHDYDFAVHIIKSLHERMYNIMGPERIKEFTVESCLKDIPDLPLPTEGESSR